MPRLLAIDTSTEACSVAYSDGTTVIERFVEAPREHMLRLLPMVDELLTEQGVTLRDLDAIAFARGPGSFTGLRICIGVVQGLAFGADLPVIPISTLAVLAQTAAQQHGFAPGDFILSAIDARMDEVYWGWFELDANGLAQARGGEQVSAPEAVTMLSAANAIYRGVGTGWKYQTRLPQQTFASIDSSVLPHAQAVIQLALPQWFAGKALSVEQALPVYLRDEVAWVKNP